MSDQANGESSMDDYQGQEVERSPQLDLAQPGTSSEADEIVSGGVSSFNYFVSLLDGFEISDATSSASEMSSTSSNPCRIKFPGDHEFSVEYNVQTSQRRNMGYSQLLNKLFLNMDVWLEVKFHLSQSEALFVRILPVYVSASDLTSPVLRCPHHSQSTDPSNTDFEYVHHFIRTNNPAAVYCEDTISGRLSVLLPLDQCHHQTALVKFMCRGSDPGGPARRPVLVIFTLEDWAGRTLGRDTVEVRVCSCPKRDQTAEEEKFLSLGAGGSGIGSARRSDQSMKSEDPNTAKVVMVPVSKEDFRKVNDLAEASWIARDPNNVETIKELRRNLLKEHNEEVINALLERNRQAQK